MEEKRQLKRGAGVLMPISSLPSPYGIGTLGKAAYRFVDFLKEMGCRYWQVLPIGPTSYGDSPYQSFSAFAGNPYFIDLDFLCEEGLLNRDELNTIEWGHRPDEVDYGLIYENRFVILRKAFEKDLDHVKTALNVFVDKNKKWLIDYALYMAVKCSFSGRSWQEWDDDIRLRRENAVKKYSEELSEDILFYEWIQFKFDEQWGKLKKYANSLGISLIGDIPLYVALDSADVWATPQLFELDKDLRETSVAGVPPDLFSETGQRWGNPLYKWELMEKDGFDWWRRRMQACAYYYDVIRIDHFIGIVNYYAIPATCETALEGKWIKGPGKKFTDMINESIGDAKLIAEDLGILTKPVKDLIASNGYPGMKVLEFAMDMKPDNEYLPHNYSNNNSVVYIGTHDNETLVGTLVSIPIEQQKKIAEYYFADDPFEIASAMIHVTYACIADVAIFQMQDLLYLGNNARMNTPSTLGGNWMWRLCDDQYGRIDTAYYKRMALIYGRLR